MKYSVITKFLAILLCAAALVSCAAGAGCILLCESEGLYTNTLDSWMDEQASSRGHGIAYAAAVLHAAEHLGGCTRDMLLGLEEQYSYYGHTTDTYSVSLWQDGKQLLEGAPIEDGWDLVYHFHPDYPVPLEAASDTEGQLYRDTLLAIDENSGVHYMVNVAYYEGPEYQAVVSLSPDALDSFRMGFMTTLYNMRYHAITLLVAGLLVFAASLVYLCCAAGRRPHSEGVYPVAFNRIPLDLYLGAVIAAEYFLTLAEVEMLTACFEYGGNWAVAALIGLTAFAMALIVVAFLFALSAQFKTRGGFWWRRTVIGWILVKLFQGIRLCLRGFGAFFNMLPFVWQWVLAVILMPLVPGLFLFFAVNAWDDFWTFIWGVLFFGSIVGDLAIVGYWAYCMGQLMKGITTMSGGGLHYRIPTRHLRGRFLGFADALNSMAGAARLAAERQLKSERMKTELITNVSHDIKTPLTSIINYVDLLKKPHDEAQEQQYLEVLDRQSQRLKKLIEDLMEMSKASTGNMPVEMGQVDIVEAVNQALGEFSDKLTAAGLDPVFRSPEGPVVIQADGRLLWRVLSNLLGNAVKYAMPGTRLYLDLVEVQGNAILSLKNISRDRLNVDAEELMERFVRGDASRNTEGSGLGLNIAKSLVELQKGQMHLTVDGDLFKVTLVLPLCGD